MTKKEDILYDKIMHSISNIQQDKPFSLKASEWFIFLNNMADEMLYKQNKFALLAFVVLGLSVNYTDLLNQATYNQPTADENLYSLVYQSDIDENNMEN